jgi:hypothetical protein
VGSADRNAIVRRMAIHRPTERVVIAYASGSQAGDTVGTDLDSFEIGTTEDCLVNTKCTDVHASQLRIERRDHGWFAIPLGRTIVFHGQTLSKDDFQLRSGDLIRIGLDGNDFQFCLQTPGHPIQSVIAKYLPQSRLPPENIALQEKRTVFTQSTDAFSDAAAGAANRSGEEEKIGHQNTGCIQFWSRPSAPLIWLVIAGVASCLFLLGALAILVLAILFRSGAS